MGVEAVSPYEGMSGKRGGRHHDGRERGRVEITKREREREIE